MEQWAEIRRLHRVERVSIREIHRRTGRHCDTIRRALESEVPPRYQRPPGISKLDALKGWIEQQLRADSRIPSNQLRGQVDRDIGCLDDRKVLEGGRGYVGQPEDGP